MRSSTSSYQMWVSLMEQEMAKAKKKSIVKIRKLLIKSSDLKQREKWNAFNM